MTYIADIFHYIYDFHSRHNAHFSVFHPSTIQGYET